MGPARHSLLLLPAVALFLALVSSSDFFAAAAFVVPSRSGRGSTAAAFLPSSSSPLPPPSSPSTTLLRSSSTTSSSSRPAIDYLTSQPLQDLLPRDDALSILDELLTNSELIDDAEAVTVRNWDKLESKLREETRSASEILGAETTETLMKSVRNVEGYDPDAVRAFLGSNAVNDLFAKVLYDGIYQFFQTIDVFGNIISRLPIIGPIRNQIRDETKRQLDRTVGPLIQGFLREYTKVAVGEAADFVMSPANRKAFGSANARLVDNVLKRPVNTLIPGSETTERWREDAFEYVRKANAKDLEEYVDFVYDLVGDKAVEKAVDVDSILRASPTLQRTLDNMWERAADAREEARGAVNGGGEVAE